MILKTCEQPSELLSSTKKRLEGDFSDKVNLLAKLVKLLDNSKLLKDYEKDNLFEKIVKMKSIIAAFIIEIQKVSTTMEKLEKLLMELCEGHKQN